MNTNQRLQRAAFSLFITVVGISVVGCGGRYVDPTTMIEDANQNNVQRLSNLYVYFQTRHGWQGPNDEQEFKTFIKQLDAELLERMGADLDQVDQLFISERDGQPLTIRYQVPGSSRGSTKPVVFESVGVDGLRLVGFTNTTFQEVEEAEYNRLLAGKSTASPAVNTSSPRTR